MTGQFGSKLLANPMVRSSDEPTWTDPDDSPG